MIFDGNSIINRAFYGIKLLTTKEGVYTNAVYGFMNMFFKMLTDIKPTFVAVAFDVKAPTFRHKLFSDYKGTRKPMPDDLRPQIPLLKETGAGKLASPPPNSNLCYVATMINYSALNRFS